MNEVASPNAPVGECRRGWCTRFGMMLLVAAGVTSGCASEEAPSETSSGAAFDYEAHAQKHWDRAVSNLPSLEDAERPGVAVVRIVDRTEFSDTMLRCFQEEGISYAEATEDGEGYFLQPANEAEYGAMILADFTCSVKYPVDPKYSRPFDAEQLGELYDHYVRELVPCLERNGYPASAAPSRTTFIESAAEGGGWDPLIEVLQRENAKAFQKEIKALCPEYPPGIFG